MDARCSQPPDVRFVKDAEGTHGIESRFHVAAAHDLLLELLWNVDNFAELFPQLKSCRVLARTETSVDVAFSFDAMLKEVSYVLRRTLEREANEIRWHSLSGDIKRIRGSWLIEPAGPAQLSLATYRTFVDVGRLVPTRLVAKGAKKKTFELTDRIREVAARRWPFG